jgi:hypothetical protein
MPVSNTILVIKRSQTQNAPTSLANGELAYSFSSNRLFIGQTDDANSAPTVEWIGGKIVVDKIANLESVLTGGGGLTTGGLTLTNSTNNSVLFAKAGGVIEFVTGSSGKVLQIAANGTPTFDDLNGGTY